MSTPHLDQTRYVDVPQAGPPPPEWQPAEYEESFQGEDGTWYIRVTIPPGVRLFSPYPTVTEGGVVFRRIGDVTPEEMAAMLARYPSWANGDTFAIGDFRTYGGSLWRCVQAHTAQANWTPDAVPALWVAVAPPEVIPVWVQPTGAHDAYNIGDKVLFPDENGTVYESVINANVWSPTAYPAGWQEVS